MTTLHRGDSFSATVTLTDTSGEDPAPLDLAGKRVTVTCKDKIDGQVIYQHWIECDAGGAVTSSQGMELDSTAAAGVITETFSSTETEQFRPTRANKAYVSDLEIRVIGNPDVVETVIKAQPETVTGDITLPPS